MNWEAAAAIGEILGAVAVVATLGYLAVQTRQNTEATQANTRQAILESDQQLLLFMADRPELEAARYSEHLSDAEKAQLGFFLLTFARIRESNWFQYRAGVLDERAWDSYAKSCVGVFGTPNGRKWWRNFAEEHDQLDPEFTAWINALIAESPIFERSRLMDAFD